MKKILAIALVFLMALSLLTACGNSNSGGSNNSNGGTSNSGTSAVETVGRLNPPAWFIGEWEKTSGENQQSEKIKVTEHNVVVSSGRLDFSRQINDFGLEIKEITEESRYRLEYTSQGLDVSYTFTLQEDGSMIMMLFDAPIGNSTYTKK